MLDHQPSFVTTNPKIQAALNKIQSYYKFTHALFHRDVFGEHLLCAGPCARRRGNSSETHEDPRPVRLQLRGTPFYPHALCPANSFFRINGNVEGRQPPRNPAIQDAFPVLCRSYKPMLCASPVPITVFYKCLPQLVNELGYPHSGLGREVPSLSPVHTRGNHDLDRFKNLPKVTVLERSIK